MTQTVSPTQLREKGRAAATSVVAAVFLTALKLVVGLLTGSLGVLAEAAHSALDLGAAIITLFAVRLSDRPPDESHLYGHGKVENLSALVETMLLLATCGWIIYEALERLFVKTVAVDPSLWAFLTMGVSIAVDFSRSRVLTRAAQKYGSQALEADALHFRTDIWSSLVVIAGLALVGLGQALGNNALLLRADAVAALLVALIVVYVSVRLAYRAIDALLDRAPRGLQERIIAAVGRVADVRRVLRTRVRGSGAQVFVDIEVAVPRHLSFESSHAVTHEVQAAVRSAAPTADVVVHTVPVAEDEGALETIQAVAARGRFAVHNITAHQTRRGLWIDLDLEVPHQLSFEQAHAAATTLESTLRAEFEARRGRVAAASRIADINVHIEPRDEEQLARDLPPAERARYAAEIDKVLATIPHVRGCQDIDLRRLAGRVHLAFHVLVDADLSVADVHSLTEEFESRLRRELPQLGRVMIHTEPAR